MICNAICFWWNNWPDGNKGLGIEYVHKLKDSIMRNSRLYPNFICFTDSPDLINHPQIQARLIPSWVQKLKWNLTKIYMFSEDSGLIDKTVCFDLDCVVVDNIDHLFTSQSNTALFTCEGAYNPGKAGGSVVGFFPNYYLYTNLWLPLKDGSRRKKIENITEGSERRYYQLMLERSKIIFWDDILEDEILSYKRDCKKKGIESFSNARIVRFHGIPRPHEVKDSWVEQNWRIGG